MLDNCSAFPKPVEPTEETKTLHILIPEAAHMQARMAALASRVPFKVFMAQLMLSATPIKACSKSTCENPALTGLPTLQRQGPASVGDANSDSLNSQMKGK